jgi:hypothetical protein
MEEKVIIAGNRLIAEHIGWGVIVNTPSPDYPTQEWHYMVRKYDSGTEEWDSGQNVWTTSETVEADRIKLDAELWSHVLNPGYGRAGTFHKKWEMIMPIVKGILYGSYTLDGVRIMKQVQDALITCDIEKVFVAVVEFIKWHNENNLKNN